MAQPVHILHLHSTFAAGGKELRAVRLMNAFGDAARHTIVSSMPDQLGARDAIAAGVRYEIAQDPPSLTGKPSVGRFEAIARYMRRFDLVLTYNWGAIDGVMARRVFGKGAPPLVHHEDGFNTDEAERLNPVRNMYRRIALSAAHALAVPSFQLETIAREVWKQPAARIHRISNGIATAAYAREPDPKAIPGLAKAKGEVVIGTLAGLRAVKDLPMLVRAVGGIPEAVKLVIVGDGPERDAIRQAGDAMFMGDALALPGFLPDPARYVGLFDIFALSSKSEQQPISVMEAMAAGLPIVAPPVGDVPAMVSPENSPHLAPDWHEVHLRDRLRHLVQHADQRRTVGEANRTRARALFDEDGMIAAYRALYRSALGRPDALA